jgi:hypothetical protein
MSSIKHPLELLIQVNLKIKEKLEQLDFSIFQHYSFPNKKHYAAFLF